MQQLGGLFDDLNFGSGADLGISDWFGGFFGSTPGTTTPTTPGLPAPTNNLQFLTSAVMTYLRERDLNKLNRELIENGRNPLSAAQAQYMADQYRLNGSIALPGQSNFMSWLPWIALAGVGIYFFANKR